MPSEPDDDIVIDVSTLSRVCETRQHQKWPFLARLAVSNYRSTSSINAQQFPNLVHLELVDASAVDFISLASCKKLEYLKLGRATGTVLIGGDEPFLMENLSSLIMSKAMFDKDETVAKFFGGLPALRLLSYVAKGRSYFENSDFVYDGAETAKGIFRHLAGCGASLTDLSMPWLIKVEVRLRSVFFPR